MSQENLERVRESYEFVDRQHKPDLDLLDADVQWHTRADLPDSTTHRGHEGVVAFMAEWWEAFDDLHADVEELIDAGDRVVAVLRLHGRVRGSSHEVDMSETHVLTMLGGKVTEIHEYRSRTDALRDLGLAE
jgi:ketosteroid isomerase-like protein